MTIKEFMINIANDIEFKTSGTIDKISASGYNEEKFISGYQKFYGKFSKKRLISKYCSIKG